MQYKIGSPQMKFDFQTQYISQNLQIQSEQLMFQEASNCLQSQQILPLASLTKFFENMTCHYKTHYIFRTVDKNLNLGKV
jgi:hypothetical protein